MCSIAFNTRCAPNAFPSCPLPPPFPSNSLCINDTWRVNNIVIPDGQNITLNGSITVNGTFVQQPNGTLVIIIGGPTNATIVQVLGASPSVSAASPKFTRHAGNANVSGTLQIIFTSDIVTNTSVQVLTSPSLSGSFTDIVVSQPGGSDCISTQQDPTSTGIAVLFSVGSDCSTPQTTSSSGTRPPRSKSKTNYALIGGLVGGIVGFFVIVLIVAFILYKARACRWLFESRDDELIL